MHFPLDIAPSVEASRFEVVGLAVWPSVCGGSLATAPELEPESSPHRTTILPVFLLHG